MKEDYYVLIKNKLVDNEIYGRVKDISKERNTVVTYYDTGRLLSEAGSRYGEGVIKEYAKKLSIEVGRKYDTSTLKRMRQFYNLFPFEKGAALPHQLSWSHFQELLPIKDIYERDYYINITINQKLSHKALRLKIKSKEYYRLPLETRNKLITNNKLELKDAIKNPIIIKTDQDILNERLLQKVILEDIPSFLEELGPGFTFIKNEYKIQIGDRFNYIDLLLFNYIYNCFVVVELKVNEYKKEYAGQIEAYMNYIDSNLKRINHNPTLGIVLVKKNDGYYIEYSSNELIIAREYIILNI